MDPQRHASLLRQCGVTWYVLRDPAGTLPALPRCTLARPLPAAMAAPDPESSRAHDLPPVLDEREPPPIDYDDSLIPEEAAAAAPAAALAAAPAEARRLLEDMPPRERRSRERPAAETVPTRAATSPAPAAEPFHLLVLAYENVALFVCAIKSARLSPAWEQSARGFLDDVVRAITRANPVTARLEYFSWPMAGKPGRAPPRGDATEVTAGFLQNMQRQNAARRVFLLGEAAHRHAAAFAGMEQVTVAPTHSLGEFFTQPQLKADLWQLLQQGA